MTGGRWRAAATLASIARAPWFHFASGALIAVVWLMFAVAHVVAFIATREFALLFFCAAETITAFFLLVRTQPSSVASSPAAWIVAALGTFAPLLLRPGGVALVPGAQWGVVVGTSLQIAATLSLNRSFAIVPSLRELKTGGLYGYVRHPIYASYLITLAAYVAGNFSPANLVPALVAIALIVLRARMEEAHLRAQPAYIAYCRRVRWRLIPFVY